MYGIIIILIVIIAILLILVVLSQNPKGGGLSSQFGGSGTSQLMGVKKTGDLLEKLTWGFAISLLVLSISTNFIQSNQEEDTLSSPNVENAQNTAVPSPEIQPLDTGSFNLEELTGETETATDSNNTEN